MDAFRDNRIGRVINSIIKDFGFYFSICLGVFIFILFFQPFPTASPDLNDNLTFTAGLAFIILLTIIIVRNILPSLFRDSLGPVFPTYTDSLIILLVSSIALAFYLRYAGSV